MLLEQIVNDDQYAKWKKLVNMSSTQLKAFLATKEGKEAGLTKAEAGHIKTGHESAQAILRMKAKRYSEWTDTDRRWMGRQISFISRMNGNEGPLYKTDKDGNKTATRKLTSLLVWGHCPSGVSIRNGKVFIA